MSKTILEQFTTDLTALAQQGKLDPIMIGHDHEIDQLVQILSRPEKNCAVLITDCGRMDAPAIVEAVAQGIVSGSVPDSLCNKCIRQFDLGSFVYKAQSDETTVQIIEALSLSGNDILFIDELAIFMTGGFHQNVKQNLEALLMAAVSKNRFSCFVEIRASDFEAWQKEYPILSQQFQFISVNEISIEDTLRTLHAIKKPYEAHHQIAITDEAIEAAVRLSAKFVHDRKMPDKAVDLIDEAAVRYRFSVIPGTTRAKMIVDELTRITNTLKNFAPPMTEEWRQELQKREGELSIELSKLQPQIEAEPKDLHLGAHTIAEVVAEWTGLSLDQIMGAKDNR